jgi:hypothetical protein
MDCSAYVEQLVPKERRELISVANLIQKWIGGDIPFIIWVIQEILRY